MLKSFSLVLVLFGATAISQHPPVSQFRVIRQWKYLNFTWPDEDFYLNITERGLYRPKNILLKRTKYFAGFFYVTLPRMKSGVPATLARIPEGLERGTSPALEPYPSWEMNAQGNCTALQNVQSIEIDDKGFMWILDLGASNVLEPNPRRTCPPKLLIYDIVNNALNTTYTFPQSIVQDGSYVYDLVIDGNFAYISDNSADNPGIVVYSRNENASWKIIHPPSMAADQAAREFVLDGVVVSYPINIAAIALGPRLKTENGRVVISSNRDVFYCPLSSHNLYSIDTDVLRSKANAGLYNGEVKQWGAKASQTDSMIMDNQGILYYNLLSDNSIAVWNSRTPFTQGQQVIARDTAYIQWVSSFTFDNRGSLTVLSNRLQNFISYGEFNISQNNFWLLSAQTGARSYVYDFNDYQPLPTTSPDYEETSKLDVNGNVSKLTTTTTSTTTTTTTTTMPTTSSVTNKPMATNATNSSENSGGKSGVQALAQFNFLAGNIVLLLLLVFNC